jgi:2-polyprenyl-3-methyl-5-hydroxy-6-metoxy-1,4-benzoquinol methylase
MTKCWCGTEAETWEHPDYDRCPRDGTLVLKDEKRPVSLKDFYSRSGYWEEFVAERYGFPSLQERREAMLPRSKWWMDAIVMQYGKVPDSIYEIGSAEGTFLTVAREAGVLDVLGHDVDEGTANYVKETHDIDCIHGLFPDERPRMIGGENGIIPFDVVCGFDVLEHVPDPVGFLRAAWDQLAPGGMLAFQTPCYREEGPTFKHLKAPEHIFIWTPQGAADMYTSFAKLPLRITNAFFMKDMMLWSSR